MLALPALRLHARLAALAVGVWLAILGSATVFAADIQTFSQARFETAQAEGRPIVVDIAAKWCTTCAAQKPIIERLAADPAYREMIIFHVDYDNQKDVVRSLGARWQSTLIAFNGAAETARSVGDTNAGSIAALFRSAPAGWRGGAPPASTCRRPAGRP